MVYMLLGTGFEETEAVAPLDLLRRAGVEVLTVGVDGKRGDFDYFFCMGCGSCANACPFNAITMVKDEK